MPAPRSSSGRSGPKRTSKPAVGRQTKAKRSSSSSRSQSRKASASSASPNVVEQLINRIVKPLGLVLLTRERIQEVLDEAAERGRVTRADANELVLELLKRGRQQTDDLLKEAERRVGRSRDQLGSATRRVRGTDPVDRIVRSADRARRSVGVGPAFPILGYDELTAGQVEQRLKGCKPADLRKVRDYERRHANRKSVLDAIERALA
jgi:polyhydroxyalkanoate synthesis regulator phasin